MDDNNFFDPDHFVSAEIFHQKVRKQKRRWLHWPRTWWYDCPFIAIKEMLGVESICDIFSPDVANRPLCPDMKQPHLAMRRRVFQEILQDLCREAGLTNWMYIKSHSMRDGFTALMGAHRVDSELQDTKGRWTSKTSG